LGKVVFLARFLQPALIFMIDWTLGKLAPLDAPVISLDYIHNNFHCEIKRINRRLGCPYISYVANLDQVTNYPPHLDIPDYLFVWGDFHKAVLSDRYSLPMRKMRCIGFCRSDSLVNIAPKTIEPFSVVYFCAAIPSNDPDYESNLKLLVGTLEEYGKPYRLSLKKHPNDGIEYGERYLDLVRSMELRHGELEFIGCSWEKYSKLERRNLSDKNFSDDDLRRLLAQATHVFSSTSTTTLEAALAGAKSYFINLDGKVDGCFQFEHLRILVDTGVIRMVRRPEEFREIVRETAPQDLTGNRVIANVGLSSRAFAQNAAAFLFPGYLPPKEKVSLSATEAPQD
jgi:hypothetical protein